MDKMASTLNWSIEWEDKPILLLVMQKPKMSYKEILDVLVFREKWMFCILRKMIWIGNDYTIKVIMEMEKWMKNE